MNSQQIARFLQSFGYEYTKTTTGVHTWWFEGMAIAEDDKKSESVYQAYNWHRKNYKAPQLPEPAQEPSEAYKGNNALLNQENRALRQRIAELEAQVSALQSEKKALISDLRDSQECLQKERDQLAAAEKKVAKLEGKEETVTGIALEPIDEMGDGGFVWHGKESPEPCTLTEEEIVWCARNAIISGYRFHNREWLPKSLSRKVTVPSRTVYELYDDFNTPANRAAIEARHKELVNHE